MNTLEIPHRTMDNGVVIWDVEQGSTEWFKLREGLITGSISKDFFNLNGTLKKQSVINSHIAKRVAEIIVDNVDTSSVQTFDMEQGSLMEEEAGLDFRDKGFESVGFITNPSYRYFGYSPDLIKITDNEIKHSVEIKCPLSHTHISYIYDGAIPNIYKPQVMMPFILFPDLDTVTFRSYDPNNTMIPKFDLVKIMEDERSYLNNLERSMVDISDIIDDYIKKIKNMAQCLIC